MINYFYYINYREKTITKKVTVTTFIFLINGSLIFLYKIYVFLFNLIYLIYLQSFINKFVVDNAITLTIK